MSVLYLHVGTPKTGTSAIQAFLGLAKNQQVLDEAGFAFPHFRDFRKEDDAVLDRNAHTLIYGAYLNMGTYDWQGELREEFWEKVLGLLNSGKNVILSDESVWHVSVKIDRFYEDIRERVEAEGHEVKVIVYLRRQDQLLQSYWRYKVMIARRHLRMSFKKYVESNKFAYFPLDYYKRLSEIADAVGGVDHVIVRAYEPSQFYNNSIVADFLQCVGLELTDAYAQADMTRNQGIDFACCDLKRRLNEFESVQKSDALRPYLVRVSDRNKEMGRYQTPSLFTKKDYEEFMSRYEESNRKTAEVFMQRKDGILFHDKERYAEKDPEMMMTETERLRICTEVMDMMDEEIRSLRAQLKKLSVPTWKGVFHMAKMRMQVNKKKKK